MDLIKKLEKIQQELHAPKGQRNDFGKYNFRSCEDILAAVKPLLKDCILLLTDEAIMLGEWHYIKATATLKDSTTSISVNAYAREEPNRKGMDASQISGAASSYARKYACNGLFSIDNTADADTMSPPVRTQDKQKDKAYIDACRQEAERIGAEAFVECLKSFDVQSADEITDRQSRVEFFNLLKNT